MEAHEPIAHERNPIDVHQVEQVEHKPKGPAIERLFKACTKMGASDLHLKAGQPPSFRVKGDIRKAQERPLSTEDIEQMIFEVLTESQKQFFAQNGPVDF